MSYIIQTCMKCGKPDWYCGCSTNKYYPWENQRVLPAPDFTPCLPDYYAKLLEKAPVNNNIKIEVEKIENGYIVHIEGKKTFCETSWGVGVAVEKYLAGDDND